MITLDDFLAEASAWAHFKNTAARIKTKVVRSVLPARARGAIAATGLVGRSLQPGKPPAMKQRLRAKARQWATQGVNFSDEGNYRGYRKLQEDRMARWGNVRGRSPVHAAQNMLFHGGAPRSMRPPFPRSRYERDEKWNENAVRTMPKDKKRERVALSSIRTHQDGVTPGKVRLFMRAKNISGGGIHLRRRPDGTHDIIDGTHRLSSARLRGDTHADAYVHD